MTILHVRGGGEEEGEAICFPTFLLHNILRYVIKERRKRRRVIKQDLFPPDSRGTNHAKKKTERYDLCLKKQGK